MDRLDAMAAFVAVAEHRSFAAAARRLAISPSAATRLVAALEQRLGIRLLQRTTRSVTLTDAGARYLESARRILAAVDDAESSARAEVAVPTGRFVVAAPLVFGRREVAPLFSDFLARWPEVTGELVLADRVVNLLEEGVDVAVRIGVLADSSLRVRPLGKTRRVLVASPEYLERRKVPRRPRDLERHALVQFTGLSPTPEWRFDAEGGDERVAFRPAFVTNSADAAIGHAERGGGIAMALSYQVADAVRRGALRVVLARFEPPPLPIQLVYPAARLVSASLRAFVDLAIEARSWSFVDG
ncbi:MAG: LysR family transcriptional regulator [Myxococcales bacterium]|nr:LysR family transcriptional regulator [Myxococcales bacterium]